MGCGATPRCRYFQLICHYFLTLLLFGGSYPRAFSVAMVISSTDLANQSDVLDANKFDLFANQPDASIATESDNSIGHQSDDSIAKESDNSIANQFNDLTVHKGDLIRIGRENCTLQRSFHPHRVRLYPFGRRRRKFDDGLLQLNVLSAGRQLRRTFVEEAMVEGKHMLQPSARKFFEERSSYLGPSARKRRRRKVQEIVTLPLLPANPSVIIAHDNREIHRNNGEFADLSSAREKLTQGRSLQLDFSFSLSSSFSRWDWMCKKHNITELVETFMEFLINFKP